MAIAIRMIVGTILFTVAFNLSSRLLEDNAAREWVDVAMYIGFTGFLQSQIVLSIQRSEKSSTSAFTTAPIGRTPPAE
jgi:hypothetical protein